MRIGITSFITGITASILVAIMLMINWEDLFYIPSPEQQSIVNYYGETKSPHQIIEGLNQLSTSAAKIKLSNVYRLSDEYHDIPNTGDDILVNQELAQKLRFSLIEQPFIREN